MQNQDGPKDLNQYLNEDGDEYELTFEEIKILDERREKRLNSESKTYTWKQAKEIILKN